MSSQAEGGFSRDSAVLHGRRGGGDGEAGLCLHTDIGTVEMVCCGGLQETYSKFLDYPSLLGKTNDICASRYCQSFSNASNYMIWILHTIYTGVTQLKIK